MRKFRLSRPLCAVVVATVFATSANAAVSPTKSTYVFEAIDDVGTSENIVGDLVISGLELGADEPVEEIRFRFDRDEIAAKCERYALLAMERPGKYLLELHDTFAWRCRLRVRAE